eukprot:536153-Prorocentrum_minimum.AAC.1
MGKQRNEFSSPSHPLLIPFSPPSHPLLPLFAPPSHPLLAHSPHAGRTRSGLGGGGSRRGSKPEDRPRWNPMSGSMMMSATSPAVQRLLARRPKHDGSFLRLMWCAKDNK